jgi:hypothetical protein
MPRLFRPVADHVYRGVIGAAGIVPILAATGFTLYSHSSLNTKVEEPRAQPAPFSHRHHSSELGIDCRYCHTSVETSPFAGIPPTKTCMSCHSIVWRDSPLVQPVRESWRTQTPITWNRVNDLPEFVYFDHSIHISKGVSCNICHGPVQDMPLMRKAHEFPMVWCLECHRHPERYLIQVSPKVSPEAQVFKLYWNMQAGNPLTVDEQHWASGANLPKVNESEGRRLVKQEHLRTAELADCEICHR